MPVQRRSVLSTLGIWPFVSLIPLGFGAWAPIVMGVKALMNPKAHPDSKWLGFAILLGAFCSTLVATGWLLVLEHSVRFLTRAHWLIAIGWLGAVGMSGFIVVAQRRASAPATLPVPFDQPAALIGRRAERRASALRWSVVVMIGFGVFAGLLFVSTTLGYGGDGG